MTCIRKEDIQKIKSELKAQGLSITSMRKKYNSTESRVDFFKSVLADEAEAQFFNNKYENYLLKRQKDRLREWVRQSAKKGIDTSTAKTLVDKIDGLKKALGSAKKSDFLNGLIEQKLGFGLTKDEATAILSANNNIVATKKAVLKKYPEYMNWGKSAKGMANFETALKAELESGVSGELLNYGLAVVNMKKIYDAAKIRADYQKRVKSDSQAGALVKKAKEAIITLGGITKSFKASLDLSAMGRQLLPVLFADPNSKSFAEAAKTMGSITKKYLSGELSAEQRDVFEAMIYLRPNHMNGVYKKLGVAVGIQEEAYPETFVNKVLNRALGKSDPFAATELAFTAPIQMARASMADQLVILAEGDIGTLKAQGAGDYVNMMTGRGKSWFMSQNAQRIVNSLMFSPRWLSARLEMVWNLKDVPSLFGEKTKGNIIARKRGAAALRQLAFYTFLPILVSQLIGEDDDKWGDDEMERLWNRLTTWTSSDFGKIVWGDTRFDVSGGYAAVLSLAAKIARGYKTTTSGAKREQGWGKTLGDFFAGKMSPAARTVIDITTKLRDGDKAKDFMYQPITWGGIAVGAIAPITIGEGLLDLFTQPTENKTAQVIGITMDFFGIASNTYGLSDKDMGKSDEFKRAESRLARTENRYPMSLAPSASSAIMKKLSGATQERAISDFSKLYNDRATALVKSREYQRMTSAEQKEALSDVRKSVSRDINKKYGLK